VKKIKHIQTGKARVKLSLFVDGIIQYAEKCKNSTKTLLELNSVKFQDTELTYKNQWHFCTSVMRFLTKKIVKGIPFTIAGKIKLKHKRKFSQGSESPLK
jgi:hypothetical protein